MLRGLGLRVLDFFLGGGRGGGYPEASPWGFGC